jgi:hypothetical protein
MASKVGSYLNKVSQALPLLEEILQTVSSQVPRNRALEIAIRLDGVNTFIEADAYIDSLINYQPQPILETSQLDDGQILVPEKLQSLIQWITKRMHLESTNQLKAIIKDIEDQISIIEENLSGSRKFSKIDSSLRAIDRSRMKLQDLAVNNMEAIEASIRDIESSAETWFMRQEMAQGIERNYVMPMGKIIAIEGLFQQTVNLAAGKLRDIEKSIVIPKDLIERSRNLRRAMDDTLSIVLKQHRESLSQVSHLLKAYSEKPSLAMLGAVEALRQIQLYGLKKIKRGKKLHINSWKLNEIWNDDEIFYLLSGLSDYEVDVEIFEMPTAKPELESFISSEEIKLLMKDHESVNDVLGFILEQYPSHNLSTCVNVTLQLLSGLNGESIHFGNERIIHLRNDEQIEVMPIGIK